MVRTSRNATAALTTANSIIAEAQFQATKRVVIMLTNLEAAGGETAYISVGAEAAANKGIVLTAGQSVTFSKDAGYLPSQERFHAVATGNMNLAIYEEFE